MSGDEATREDDPPATLAALWDQLCDRFEQGWRAGQGPAIEDFLGDMPEPGRPALFRELLTLELAYRAALGQRPSRDEYDARFPGFAAQVRSVFDSTRPEPPAPSHLRHGTSEVGLDLLSGPPSHWRDLLGPRILAAMQGDTASTNPGPSASLGVGMRPTGRAAGAPANERPGAAPDGSERACWGDPRRYRILRPHARGGLGMILVALDEELNREVAVKQIQERFAGDPGSRARFLVEAVITGNLEHPGVVPIYGVGWRDRRPYYAMRLIRGESLKEAIGRFREGRLDPGARSLALRKLLGRFTTVCDTVAYAHDRGVLHRDLKPANIMLGPYGETLVVDWGLATPIRRPAAPVDQGGGPPAPGREATAPGPPVGTPVFMSPEQAAGARDRLGPASDVYSLGATLYCLLTGRAPFEGEPDDVLRAVQKGEFPPPQRLDPTLDPALEAICLKAMATRPEDRYATPRALADDVERWAADEPVSAWKEPLSRRARRWARRHRTAAAAAAAALLAGVIGLSAVSVVQARSNVALKRANEAIRTALDDARAAREQTSTALVQSEESRKQAEAVGDFLVDALARPDPAVGGRGVKVVDVLDQAAAGLSREFRGPKVTEGALLDALGRSYYGLGLYKEAEAMHRRARAVRESALGRSHRETLRSATRHAGALWALGRTDEGEALLEATLEWKRAALGPDDPDTLDSRAFLANSYALRGRVEEAIAAHREVLAVREAALGTDHPDTLKSRHGIANAYQTAGRLAEAIPLFEQALRRREAVLGADHPDTLWSRRDLATAYKDAGRVAEAIPLLEQALRRQESVLGPDHLDTVVCRHDLANAYHALGRYAEAIPLYERALRQEEAWSGHESMVLSCSQGLAGAYQAVGRYAEAIPHFERVLRRREATLGPVHPETLDTRRYLGTVYRDSGRWVEAVALYRGALERYASALGPGHPEAFEARRNLAEAYEKLGRRAEAEPLLRENVAWRRKADDSGGRLPEDLTVLGLNLVIQRKWSGAELVWRECLAIREKSAPDDWSRFAAMNLLGWALLGQGRCADAEPLIVAGYEGMEARSAKIPASDRVWLTAAAMRVVRLYEAWGKPTQAARWRSKLGLAELPADVFAPP
jgi:tetratricopeptide (TPR) repeat protein